MSLLLVTMTQVSKAPTKDKPALVIWGKMGMYVTKTGGIVAYLNHIILTSFSQLYSFFLLSFCPYIHSTNTYFCLALQIKLDYSSKRSMPELGNWCPLSLIPTLLPDLRLQPGSLLPCSLDKNVLSLLAVSGPSSSQQGGWVRQGEIR